MNEQIQLKPYDLETELTGYMPIPRQLLDLDLPSTAVLIYGALLDRGTLSRKNQYTDENRQIYVIYPVQRLAETFRISDTAVKRHLRQLESLGLIRRHREKRHCPSHIFLCLPAESIQGTGQGTNCTDDRKKTPPQRERKVPPNNRREQHNRSNYYQHSEEESL